MGATKPYFINATHDVLVIAATEFIVYGYRKNETMTVEIDALG